MHAFWVAEFGFSSWVPAIVRGAEWAMFELWLRAFWGVVPGSVSGGA